jgi:hypothetical protein
MSLKLAQGTKPLNLEIKTYGLPPCARTPTMVYLGDYEISMEDWIEATMYVLTNTDLVTDDPRLPFLERLKKLEVSQGFNPNAKRLDFKEPIK